MAVPWEINTSLYPESPVSPAQVSTTDRLQALPPRHTGSSAQPPWGEWPQEFWDRSGAAQEQAEDEAWGASLQAPQQPDKDTDETAEVYDWGDYPAKPMPGEVYGHTFHDTCPTPRRIPELPATGPEPPPETDPEPCWLRHHDGQWQRKVLLHQLKHHDQFYGLTGWAAVDALEASAGGTPTLLRVHVDSLNRAVHVNSANVFLVSPSVNLPVGICRYVKKWTPYL